MYSSQHQASYDLKKTKKPNLTHLRTIHGGGSQIQEQPSASLTQDITKGANTPMCWSVKVTASEKSPLSPFFREIPIVLNKNHH